MANQIGVIGLAVMGANLARNLARRGFKVGVFNRTWIRTEELVKKHGGDDAAVGGQLNGSEHLAEFVAGLEVPRKIILMVQAGQAVDEMLSQLRPLLSKGDMVIDGGNSFYLDTERRATLWAGYGLHFVGMGISGGEEGALHGPSLMPGGSAESWKALQPLLEKIAAKDFSGNDCVTHVGTGGAGHFVKMVHNGIEYAIMQIIAEIYDFSRKLEGLSADEIADRFENMNVGLAKSYLLDITIPVLRKKCEQGANLVDLILDKAAQKGTGGWTAIEGIKAGIPVPAIADAVLARTTSSYKADRVKLAGFFPKNRDEVKILADFDWSKVFIFAQTIAFVQGLHLIAQTSKENSWGVDLAETCRIWQGGCIIRTELLKTLSEELKSSEGLENLLENSRIADLVKDGWPLVQELVVQSIRESIAVPVAAGQINYLSAMTEAESPANLIQGLRDFFGAHTFERKDKEGVFHEIW